MAVVNAQSYISMNSTLIHNTYLNYLYGSADRAFHIWHAKGGFHTISRVTPSIWVLPQYLGDNCDCCFCLLLTFLLQSFHPLLSFPAKCVLKPPFFSMCFKSLWSSLLLNYCNIFLTSLPSVSLILVLCIPHLAARVHFLKCIKIVPLC